MAEDENKLYPSSRLAEEIALADYTSSLPLPVEPLPTHYPYELAGGQKVASSLFGTNGQERFQSWPERMIRSGTTLPGDVYGGKVDPLSEEGIQRTQDLAGLGVTGPLAMKPGTASVGSGMTRMAKTGEVEHAPAFYSAVENAVKGAKQGKATAEEWTNFLKNQQGIKPEELAWTLKDLPSGSITKKQLEDHIAANKIEIKEVVKGEKGFQDKVDHLVEQGYDFATASELALKDFGGKNETKYSKYQLPGGENYKELLLTLPEKKIEPKQYTIKKEGEQFRVYPKDENSWVSQHPSEASAQKSIEASQFRDQMAASSKSNYKSSHWDEPNVLAHIRMNDRTVNGKKTLHIEEIQSDWHQAGRKQGYKSDQPQLAGALGPVDILGSKVPDAPFKKTWDELALKKVIRHAAENGYDQISWTPGEAQAARYDLSKHVDELTYYPNTKDLQGFKDGKEIIFQKNVSKDKLADHIGKEAAEKILNNPTNKTPAKEGGDNLTLSGTDLKVGGEGMKAFYDKMLVDKANALGKKFGSKVEQGNTKKTFNELDHEIIERADGTFSVRYDITNPNTPDVRPKFKTKKEAEEWREEKFGGNQPIHTMQITPEMKQQVLDKGFPLFSAGLPTLTPVDHDPWEKTSQKNYGREMRANKYRLVPVSHNPFET